MHKKYNLRYFSLNYIEFQCIFLYEECIVDFRRTVRITNWAFKLQNTKQKIKHMITGNKKINKKERIKGKRRSDDLRHPVSHFPRRHEFQTNSLPQ